MLYDTSSELAASLALLSDALEDPGVDIAASTALLSAEARGAVGSYLGLTVLISGDPAVAFTVLTEPGATPQIRSSLRLPLRGDRVGDAGVVFILYAGAPGAFVDLAADLAWMSDRSSTEPHLELEVDRHLQPDALPEGTVTVGEALLINQAVGVLLARGATPEGALRDIDARAARDGTDRATVAAQIVAALS